MKALNRKAEKRFDSAAQMGAALRDLLPPDGETASMGSRTSPGSRVGLLAMGAAALLLAGFGVWYVFPAGETSVSDTPDAPIPEPTRVVKQVPAVDDAGPVVVVAPQERQVEAVVPEDEDGAGEGAQEDADAKERSAKKTREGEEALRRLDLDGARVAFDEAIKLDSRNSRAWYGLGKAAFQSGDYETAIDKTERALRYSPANRPRRIFLGKIYLAAGQKDNAIAQWKRVLAVDPDNQSVKDLIARATGG